MSEEQKPRTIDQLNEEYRLLCMQAGELKFKQHLLEQNLQRVQQRLVEINAEAASLGQQSVSDSKEG